MKVPISLIIDDPSPVLSVYYTHHKTGKTEDGREVLRNFPNEFLFRFCDIVEERGIRGKFSVVPMPGNCGDIVNGIDGVDDEDREIWIETVKKRISPQFSIGPEMLSHNKAVDLATGKALDVREDDWAKTQDRSTFTPYISKAFSLLKQAGFDSCGVTSPWAFGIEREEEYVTAISQALWNVYGKKNAWYFLRGLRGIPNAKPWLAYENEGRCVVSVPATTNDAIWQTINTTDESDEFVSKAADEVITADGKSGSAVQVLETGGYPILITHWQSLASNGLFTGLRVLDEIACRVNKNLSDRVEWMSAQEMMELVLKNKKDYPKPSFEN